MGKRRESAGRRAPRPTGVEMPSAEAESRSLELLWGSGMRPPRGPKPGLSLDAIVSAAIELADTEGLGAVTMTRVAERLSVTTMALYRYVPGRQELIDLIIDAGHGSPPVRGNEGWRLEMTRWARASLEGFQRRPWLLHAAEQRVPIGPNWIAWLDAGVAALEDSGLSPRAIVPAVMLVDGHVRATARLSAGAAVASRWVRDFGQVLQSVMGDPRYPSLTRLVAAGGFSPGPGEEETPFEFGLRHILDGLEAGLRGSPVRRATARRR